MRRFSLEPAVARTSKQNTASAKGKPERKSTERKSIAAVGKSSASLAGSKSVTVLSRPTRYANKQIGAIQELARKQKSRNPRENPRDKSGTKRFSSPLAEPLSRTEIEVDVRLAPSVDATMTPGEARPRYPKARGQRRITRSESVGRQATRRESVERTRRESVERPRDDPARAEHRSSSLRDSDELQLSVNIKKGWRDTRLS